MVSPFRLVRPDRVITEQGGDQVTAFNYTKGAVCYETDNGASIRCKVSQGYTSQTGLGWAACQAGSEPRRKSLHPRQFIMRTAAGVIVPVIVATPTAYTAGEIGTFTCTVPVAGQAVEATLQWKQGEHDRGVMYRAGVLPS